MGEELLHDNPVAVVVRALMEEQDEWSGTATELLNELDGLAERYRIDTRARLWPKAPQSLSRRLNEVRPNLAAVGIQVEQPTRRKKRTIALRKVRKNTVDIVDTVESGLEGSSKGLLGVDGITDTLNIPSAIPSIENRVPGAENEDDDGSDDTDGISGVLSDPDFEERAAIMEFDGGLTRKEAESRNQEDEKPQE